MELLGNGLYSAHHREDALSVFEAELSMKRRLGASESRMLIVQGNIANAYHTLGRYEEALRLMRDVYSGYVKLYGEEYEETLQAASNYAASLKRLERFEEAKSLLRKTIPLVQRVRGESHDLTLRMRWNYAGALYRDPAATLDDLREAVATLEDTERIAHPTTKGIENELRAARAARRARENAATLDPD